MSWFGFVVLCLALICTSSTFVVAAAGDSCFPTSFSRLVSSYDNSIGLFDGVGWWNSANSLTVLVNNALYGGADNATVSQTLAIVERTYALYSWCDFTFCPFGICNDDAGWWALMFQGAHDLALRSGGGSAAVATASKYLNTSAFLFDSILISWSNTTEACGGGVWWCLENHYKNAIPNELFLAIGSGLALRLPKNSDRHARFFEWAQKELDWFVKSGMINSAGTINDGLTSDCKNNGDTTWTYNQGVILGGLAALYQVDNNTAHLNLAVSIYSAAVAALTNDGVLHEPCEPNCGSSGCQFKGIFARNVMYLENVLSKIPAFSNATSAMRSFIATNAASICSHDAGSGGLLGIVWSGPFDNSTASVCTLTSALDCLVANINIQQRR